jgi:hypothetical protein
MKTGSSLLINDPTSPYNGKTGKVVTTASTSGIPVVSLRFEGETLAVWFLRSLFE